MMKQKLHPTNLAKVQRISIGTSPVHSPTFIQDCDGISGSSVPFSDKQIAKKILSSREKLAKKIGEEIDLENANNIQVLLPQ